MPRAAHPLTETLSERFPSRIRARGDDYHASGLVRLVDLTPTGARAEVLGSDVYDVGIEWGAGLGVFCSCPAFSKFGPCKHVWAVLVALDEERADPARRAATTAVERLEELRRGAAAGARDPWRGAGADDARLRYELDVDESLATGRLVFDVESQRRTKKGSWGSARPYRPGSRNAPPLTDPLDRRVLAVLAGARLPWESPSSARSSAPSDYALEADLALELLPTLCATGRLYWKRARRRGGPLAWDPGPAWLLRTGIDRSAGDVDQGAGEVELTARLERGDERMELAAPLILFGWGVVCTEDAVARFDPRDAMPLVVELRSRGPLRLPAADEARLVDVLMQFPAGLGDDAEWRRERVTPEPALVVEQPEFGPRRAARLACTLAFDYAGRRVDPEEPGAAVALEEGRVLVRDFAFEERAIEQFLAAGGRRNATDGWLGGHGSVARGKLPELVRALLAEGWVVEAEGELWRQPGALSARVRSGIDWFDLEGGVAYGDQVAPLPELIAAAREGRKTVRLGDGSVGVLPERWLERWAPLALAGRPEGDALRFESNQAWLLDALLAEREGVETDAGFERARERLAGFCGVEPAREPDGFRGTLRDYQRDGVGWMRFLSELGLGGCLADDMGLGKTVQVLAFLLGRERSKPSLVVAPRSVVFNWVDEAARFAPELAVLDYRGLGRRHLRERFAASDVVVTTYGTLRRDATVLKDVEFDCVVLDEAQAIKNASSQAAKAARLLRAEQRLALSGTPVENHLGELWSLFEFLNPGMLGTSAAFKRLGARPGVNAGREHVDFLARALRPFFLRRTKDEVLDDLPPKTEQTLHCELSRTERRRYDELREHYRTALFARADEVGIERMKIHVLEGLLRLRQAACHPALLDPARAGDGSAKVDTLLEQLAAVVEEGHKALVFSQFTKLLAVVRSRLDAAGHAYEYLDGRTRKRREKVARFQSDPDCPLFLISLKAGGHGLNLTAADYVFLLDPWWNPAVEAQAIDRAHRIGQRRTVVAYRLIARDTVEEKVVELQDSKRELAAALFGGERGALRDMTREDLELLLS